MHTGARVTLLSHSAYTGTFEAHLCLETSRQRFCSAAVPESHDRPSACETLVEGRLISGGRRRTQPSAPNSDAPASRPAKPDRKNASSLLTSPPASVGCGWSFSAIVFCLQRLPPVAGAGLDGAASLQPRPPIAQLVCSARRSDRAGPLLAVVFIPAMVCRLHPARTSQEVTTGPGRPFSGGAAAP